MASIRERPRKDGTTAYAVLFRLPGSRRQHSITFNNPQRAKAYKAQLDEQEATRKYNDALRSLQAMADTFSELA